MYAKLIRIGKIVLVMLAILLGTGLVILFRTDGIILFRTCGSVYGSSEGDARAVLINLSRHAIDIRSSEPFLYGLSGGFSWGPPFPFTMQVYPQAQKQGLVQSGQVLPIDLGFAQAADMEQTWLMMEERYFYDGNEYAVYSNRFVISPSSQPPIFRAPPTGLAEVASIRADTVAPYTVLLSNHSKRAVWFNPVCSAFNQERASLYPFIALQKQTHEGTWQIIEPDRSQCTMTSESVRIGPGEMAHLSLQDGYPASATLESGVYRWHLVYYFNEPVPLECDALCIQGGLHLFTEPFKQ